MFVTERPPTWTAASPSSNPSSSSKGAYSPRKIGGGYFRDADLVLDPLDWRVSGSPKADPQAQLDGIVSGVKAIMTLLAEVVSGEKEPRAQAGGATHFQIYRGLDGHSV